jgi:DNA (cytosine-5)-methyltransferase 1
MLRVLDLFSGIGGWSVGLERTGAFETAAFCEIDARCRQVLARHWPETPIYDDVRTISADRLAGDGVGHIDVITAGFPCQDVSIAGARQGIEGERSGLWGEVARLAGELRPGFVLLENVANLLAGDRGAWFGRVLGDLAALGYDAEWHCLPASYVGAPHHRDRVWIIADRDQVGRNRPGGYPLAEHVLYDRSQWSSAPFGGWRDVVDWLESADATHLWEAADGAPRRMADGVLRGLDSPAIGACGNAVVPQIPELIGRAILQAREAA